MLAGMQNRHRSASPLLTVVVPTFNERDNVPVLADRLAAALSGIDFEIVFVDDSTDGTADVIRGLPRRLPVRLIHRTPAERAGGLTTAITCGLRVGRGAYLSSIDADLQHPPEKLREMLDAAVRANADVVVASRYCNGGSAAGLLSRTRRLVSVGSKWLSKLVFYDRLRETTDPGSGFFLIRREVIEDVELRPVGYKMLTEILVRGRWRSLTEVPYVFEARNAGQSKAGIRQGLQYLRHTLRLFIEVPHAARAWKFALVGGSGVAVNLGFLWYAAIELAAPPLAAWALGVEASILSNFWLNRTFTWRDRRDARLLALVDQGARYHIASAMGVATNFVAFSFGVRTGMATLLAGLGGIAMGMTVNFLGADRLVFTARPRRQAARRTASTISRAPVALSEAMDSAPFADPEQQKAA